MNLEDKSVLVIDHGLYVSLASRLAREFGTTFYAPIWSQSFPTYHVMDVGEGLPDVMHVQDVWNILNRFKDRKDELLICFPDIFDGGWQVYLRNEGWRVWGSAKGDDLEIYRLYFREMLAKLGLPVAPYKVIKGMDALRAYLKENDNKYVKMTCLLRGVKETFKHTKYWMTEPDLDALQHHLGIKKNEVDFIVEDEIPTKIECGGDMYSIDGRYPSIVSSGVEIKDKCSISVVQRYNDLPEEVRMVCDKMAPVLGKYQYRNFWSTEIRVAKDGTPYFIDPTCRQPSPVGESEHELWDNLGQVMWSGAEGVVIDPEPAARYAVQAMIYGERSDEEWTPIEFPESIRQWVKLYYHRIIDGHDFVMPQTTKMNECGAVVGIGDTIEDAEADCKKRAKQITGSGICVHTEAIADAKKEFDEMAKHGMNVEPIEA